MHDLQAIAISQRGGSVLGARHDFAVSLDGDGTVGEAEPVEESSDGQAVVHDAGLSIDDELHAGRFTIAETLRMWTEEARARRVATQSSNTRETLGNFEKR